MLERLTNFANGIMDGHIETLVGPLSKPLKPLIGLFDREASEGCDLQKWREHWKKEMEKSAEEGVNINQRSLPFRAGYGVGALVGLGVYSMIYFPIIYGLYIIFDKVS